MGVNSEAGLRTAWRNGDQSQQSGAAPLPNAFSQLSLQDQQESNGITQQSGCEVAAPATPHGTCPGAHPQSPNDEQYHHLRACVEGMQNSRWDTEHVGKTYSKYAKMREASVSLCKALANGCLQQNSPSPNNKARVNWSPLPANGNLTPNTGVEDLSLGMGSLSLDFNGVLRSPDIRSLPPFTPRTVCSKSKGPCATAHLREQFLGAIREWRACQERMLEALRTSLLGMYQDADPRATMRGFELLCANRSARRIAVKQIQHKRMATREPTDPSLALFADLSIAAPDGGGFLTGYEIRFGNYDLVQADLNETRHLLYAAESGIAPSTVIQDLVISEHGNAIIEFANTAVDGSPVLRFRVSSHMLAEVSPVFAQVFGQKSTASLNHGRANAEGTISSNDNTGDDDVSRHNANNNSHGLSATSLNHGGYECAIRLPPPPTRYTCDDGSEVSLYRMPQTELNTHRAMEIVLHAAHMHNDMVPRDVGFDQFVAIADVCQRYRCTSPLELVVEHRWLRQWMHRASVSAADPVPDGLLVIAFAFGMRRLFTRVSKSAVLNIVDEAELRAKPWPRSIKDRIWALREAKMQQVYTCCSNALQEYLRPAPPPPPPMSPPHSYIDKGARGGYSTTPGSSASLDKGLKAIGNPNRANPANKANITDGGGNTRASVFVPTSAPRCPKGSHACDAANLGWLMMTFAELQVLQHVMRSPNVVGHLPPPPRRNLNQLFDSLGFMTSPPPPQDGQHNDYYHGGACDYASAFRSAINDVYNSVPGLTLFEVAGRHGWALSRHRHNQPQAMNKMQLMYYYHTRRKGPEAVQMAREAVQLRILSLLDDFSDLHAAAMIDRSFYETYKKNELMLMRSVLKSEAKKRLSDPLYLPGRVLGTSPAIGRNGFEEQETGLAKTVSVKKNSMPAMATTTGPLNPVSYFDVSDDDDDNEFEGGDKVEAVGDGDLNIADPMELDSPPLMRNDSGRSSLKMVTREEAERILWPPSSRSSTPPTSPNYTPSSQVSPSYHSGQAQAPRQHSLPRPPLRLHQRQIQRASAPVEANSAAAAVDPSPGNKEKFLAGDGLVVTEHKSLLPLPSENKHLRETYERLVGLRVDGTAG